MKNKTLFTALCAAGLAVGATGLWVDSIEAADHAETGTTSASDPAADIGDFYAWHTANGTIVYVLTFAPFGSTTSAGVYDDEVLYGIHLDLGVADQVDDANVYVRFGQNGAGEWGVQGTFDTPIGPLSMEGPVETSLTQTVAPGFDVSMWAGAADDPFFFNQTGFNNTLATGTLAFDMSDQVAGLNVTAVVIEAPAPVDPISFQPITDIQAWATTARL